MLQHFSERLEKVRLDRGLTQDVMAKQIGVSKRSYCAYESGETPPSAKLLTALAGMGVDIAYLLTGLKAATHQALNAVRVGTETGMLVETITGNPDDALAVQEAVVLQSVLKPDEAALLDNYRNSPPEGKTAIRTTSAAFAQQAATQKVSGGE